MGSAIALSSLTVRVQDQARSQEQGMGSTVVRNAFATKQVLVQHLSTAPLTPAQIPLLLALILQQADGIAKEQSYAYTS